MIVQCEKCKKFYDDEFRDTGCPHNTFSANDGWNNFKHYPLSWLDDKLPSIENSEAGIYNNWYQSVKLKD